jgi:hypothetical protein
MLNPSLITFFLCCRLEKQIAYFICDRWQIGGSIVCRPLTKLKYKIKMSHFAVLLVGFVIGVFVEYYTGKALRNKTPHKRT